MKKAKGDDLDDLLKLGETALSVLLGAGRHLGERMRDGSDSLARKMDLVTRDEFDAAFAMIKKARAEQEKLDKRLSAIEKKLQPTKSKKPTKKKSGK